MLRNLFPNATHRLALLALVLAVGLWGCVRQAAPGWPGLTASSDLLFTTGGSRVVALYKDTGKEAWTFPQENARYPFTSPPTYLPEADLVLVGDNAGNLYALNAKDGRQVWAFENTGHPFTARVVVAEGRLFAPNGNGTLYVLDTQGQVVWTFQASGPLWAPVTVAQGRVYVPGMDHNVYALDADTGARIWQRELAAPVSAAPVLAEGRLLVSTLGAGLYALDPETGDILFHTLEGAWLWHGPLPTEAGLAIGDMQGRVALLDPASGEPYWTQTLAGPVVARPAWNRGHHLYVAVETGTLYALRLEDGTVEWTQTQDAWRKKLYTPPLVENGRLYLALHTNPVQVVALNENGAQLWTYVGK